VDNFYISHSEKDFLGGGGEGKRRVVLYRGTLSSQCCLDDIVNENDSHSIISYQSHVKDRHGNASRKPLNKVYSRFTGYPYLPLRNP
jgi:hypothetical protein